MRQETSRTLSTAPIAPEWAERSTPEDGGITHERISRRHPEIRRYDGEATFLDPSDVLVSVTDMPVDGEWVRSKATVYVEGGVYLLSAARELRDALDELASLIPIGEPDSGPRSTHAQGC